MPSPTYAGLGKLQLSLLPSTSPHTKPKNPRLRGPCKVPPFQKPGPQSSRSGGERWPLHFILERGRSPTCSLASFPRLCSLQPPFLAAQGLCCDHTIIQWYCLWISRTFWSLSMTLNSPPTVSLAVRGKTQRKWACGWFRVALGNKSRNMEPWVTPRDHSFSKSYSGADRKLWLAAAAQHHERGSKYKEIAGEPHWKPQVWCGFYWVHINFIAPEAEQSEFGPF